MIGYRLPPPGNSFRARPAGGGYAAGRDAGRVPYLASEVSLQSDERLPRQVTRGEGRADEVTAENSVQEQDLVAQEPLDGATDEAGQDRLRKPGAPARHREGESHLTATGY